MKCVLLFEKYTQIRRIVEQYNSNIKKDKWGGLIGESIALKNEYLMTPCVGSMHVLNTVYILATKYGYTNFVRIGSCGVRNDEIELGDVLIHDACLNKDAISEKYFPKSACIPTEKLYKKMMTLNFKACSVYTMDVSWERINTNADVVDMETTALYSLVNELRAEAVSISVARDNPMSRISTETLSDIILRTTMNIIDVIEEFDN